MCLWRRAVLLAAPAIGEVGKHSLRRSGHCLDLAGRAWGGCRRAPHDEVVAFEPQDSKGRSVPRAVFFTDRAGFLRGASRAAAVRSWCSAVAAMWLGSQGIVLVVHVGGRITGPPVGEPRESGVSSAAIRMSSL